MITPILIAATYLWSLAQSAEAVLPPLPVARPMPTLPIKDIAQGARGVCYTVFEGDTIEPFAFVVKSVMPQFLGPEDDLLLVRLLGDKPEFTGVVAGMSGSPCLIDGKLVGALSYSFAAFAKEPIAGITPIAAMTRLHEMPQESRPYRLAQAASMWPTGYDHGAARAALGALPATDLPADGPMMPAPIATPLGLGNMAPEVRAYFAPYLRAMGYLPVATGSGRQGAANGHQSPPGNRAPVALTPGSAIAVVLAQGDINMAATGTVTWVDGNKVLAFGHPFKGSGAVSWPMATSRIVNTMASSERSYKMAIAGPTVGEITQDRLTAIAGLLGSTPPMVPVKGTLTTAQGPVTFAFDVARDAVMTPRLVAMGTANALTQRTTASARGTGRLTATITVAGHEPVVSTFVDAQYNGGMVFMQPALQLYGQFSQLWDNDFAPPGAVQVSLAAQLDAEPIEETITDITFDESYARNGAKLEVAVHLRDGRGVHHVETFVLPVPARWSGQPLDIVATGGEEAARWQGLMQGAPNPQSLADVLTHLRSIPQQGQLQLYVVREGQTLRRGNRSYGSVPPTALAVLGHAVGDNHQRQSIDFQTQRSRKGSVRGLCKRSLFVAPKANLDRFSKAAKEL